MTREELDFIGSMNMCDEISNEAYKKIVCHCEGQEHCPNTVSRSDMLDAIGHSMSYTSEDLQKIIKALPPVNPQPYEDAISREDALMCLTGEWTEITDEIIHCFIKRIKALPPVNPQPKAEQFAKWVAGEIFDDMWEYNKDAFAEIACRKLAKLGIVIRMDDEWELIEPQESEGNNADSN